MIPPSDRTCPKCGNPLAYGSTVCSSCGAGSRRSSAAIAIWAVLLGVVGLPAALFGGCLLIINGSMPSSSPSSATGILIGVLGLALPVFFLVMLIRETKK